MFFASKVLALVTQPLGWVAVLLFWGLLVRRNPAQRFNGPIASALVLLLAIGWQPLPDTFLRQLEAQYPEYAPNADLQSFAGMIVLGGATESGNISQSHMQPNVNEAAERMTAAIAALQKFPKLRVVFTGGEGALMGSGPTEADRARVFFESLGQSGNHIQYESASRNTYENAILTAKMANMDTKQRWLLVTSAWHMPRSMAAFKKAGWNVTAYPVDFRTATQTPWTDYGLHIRRGTHAKGKSQRGE